MDDFSSSKITLKVQDIHKANHYCYKGTIHLKWDALHAKLFLY